MSSQPSIAYYIPSLLGLIKELRSEVVECCHISSINHQLTVLHSQKFCSDNIAEISITPRALLALIQPATQYIVLLHNHPSGKTYPSRADFETTQKILQLGELLDFKVLDHLIITRYQYFSFAESGVLDEIKSQSA